jgi:hypothetical protein
MEIPQKRPFRVRYTAETHLYMYVEVALMRIDAQGDECMIV